MKTIDKPNNISPLLKPWLSGILIFQLLATLNVSALTEVAGGGLFLNTELSYNSDTNFFGSAEGGEIAQTSISLRPTLEWSRNKGTGSLSATLGTNITRYEDLDAFNDENFNASLNIEFPIEGSQVSGGANISYNETQDVNEYLQQRVALSSFNASLNGNYRLTNKLYFNGALSIENTDTIDFSSTENQIASLGVIFANLWNDASLNLSYRYQELETSGNTGSAIDSGEGSFSASLSGQILPEHIFPNLTATVSLHINNTSSTGTSSGSSNLGYNVNVNWKPRTRTSFTLSMNSDLDLTADDNSLTNTSFAFIVNQSIGEKWDISGNIRRSFVDYETSLREDTSTYAGLSLNYDIARNWSAGASINYQKTSSVAGGKDIERGTYAVNVSYRF